MQDNCYSQLRGGGRRVKLAEEQEEIKRSEEVEEQEDK